MKFIKVVSKFIKGVEIGELTVSYFGLLIFTLLTFAAVVNRYFIHLEIMWFSNAALYCYIFTILFTIAFTTAREGHMAVNYLRDKTLSKNPRAMAIHRVSMDIISIVIVCIFIPMGYKFALRAWKHPEYGSIPSLHWFNESVLQVTLFAMVVLILVHLLIIARRDASELLKILWSKSPKGGP